MGRYRKIDPRIHNDAKFKALSERGKLLFFTILTHPHMTALGAMRATEAGLCEEMALGASGRDADCASDCSTDCASGCASDCPAGRAAGVFESYRRGFKDLIKNGLIKFDPGNACLVIPKFLKYNPPESPSVVKAWNEAGDLIPECDLRDELIENTIKFLQGYGRPDKESFLKAFNLRPLNRQAAGQAGPQTDGQTGAHQEQEQEQEQIITPPTPLQGENVSSSAGKKRPHTRKPKIPTEPYSSDFLTFIEAYPNKNGGFEKAWKEWKAKLNRGKLPSLAHLLESINLLKNSENWRKDDGQWIPQITTFIIDGRWTDADALKTGKAPQNQPDPNCPICRGTGIEETEKDGRQVGTICRCRKGKK